MAITLTAARQYARQWLRGESGYAYNHSEIDRAIIIQFDDFIRRADLGSDTVSVAISAGSSSGIDTTSVFVDKLRSVVFQRTGPLPSCPMSVVSRVQLESMKNRFGETYTGDPEVIAFVAMDQAEIFPVAYEDGDLVFEQAMTISYGALNDATVGLAQVTASINAGSLTGIAINSGGYYTSVPAVTFSGGGGTGAAATATITTDGEVDAITISNAGSGYTAAPTVLLNGVDCSTAVVVAGRPDGIPDDIARKILIYGVPALLQATMPQEPYTRKSLEEYEKLIAEFKSRFTPTASAVYTEPLANEKYTKRVYFEYE